MIKDLGFVHFMANHSVFIWKKNEEHTVIAIVTNDMAVTTKRAIDAEIFKPNIKRYWDIANN